MAKVFIDNINTYIGQSLLEEILNQDPVPNICATLNPSFPIGSYPGISILERHDNLSFNAALLECDIVIYDMHTADLNELQDKAKIIDAYHAAKPRTLIVISSVMTWGATIPKQEEMTPEDIEELKEQLGEDITEENIPKFKTVPYEESDYKKRKAPEKYKTWKGIETLVLSIGMNKPDLSIYVIASGILYGNGEWLLNYHFRSAWLENPEELPYIGSGENFIPMIHVKDLARSVKFVLQTKPQVHYIFGIDNAKSQLQKDLVSSISNGIGTGKIRSVSYESVKNEEWSEAFCLNCKLKPSKVLLPPQEGEEEEEEEDEEEEEGEEGQVRFKKEKKIKLEWHCLEGFHANVQKLNVEFNENRGLKPIKVMVTGPPASGKSHFSKKLAKFYNVPWIHVGSVVNELINMPGEFGDEVRKELEEIKETMLDELEQNKKEDEVIDPNSVKPRIPDKTLIKGFKLILKKNPCRNRGYVLDGWPKNYEQTWKLFKIKPPPKEGEEEEEEDEENPDASKLVVDTSIYAESLILFQGSDDFLINRVKALPESAIENTHYTNVDMNRRLKDYRVSNEDPSGNLAVKDFFIENSTDIFPIDCSTSENDTFESMKIYIERFGRPFNYQTHQEEAENKRIKEIEENIAAKNKKKAEQEKREEALEIDARKKREKQAKETVDKMHSDERQLLEERAQPLKNYLLDNLHEVLAKGLIKVCKKERADPIDYLAKYLFKHGDEVPHPDPSLY
ncbi:unnamed protein product [Blepharisma stoltei]|uniref:Adenylate kinase 7 n=1 Tax=Blepharisma stoltei TaxID=1481888 RepID=A0AAU9IN58_9CILI|nr:unnamed protein product [Blepharisma stoltei]